MWQCCPWPPGSICCGHSPRCREGPGTAYMVLTMFSVVLSRVEGDCHASDIENSNLKVTLVEFPFSLRFLQRCSQAASGDCKHLGPHPSINIILSLKIRVSSLTMKALPSPSGLDLILSYLAPSGMTSIACVICFSLSIASFYERENIIFHHSFYFFY